MRSVTSHPGSLGKNTAPKLRRAKSTKSDAPHEIPIAGPGTRDSREEGLNRLKPAKRSRNRIPPPQQERIRQKFIAGKGITEISREEGRNRETVAKIVRSDEVREHVLRMRENFYGLSESALEVVGNAIRLNSDAKLAYKLLEDSGVIPAPEERMQIMAETQTKSHREAVLIIMSNLIGSAVFKQRAYGRDCADIEEQLAKAGGRVDENGQVVPLGDSNPSGMEESNSTCGKNKQSS